MSGSTLIWVGEGVGVGLGGNPRPCWRGKIQLVDEKVCLSKTLLHKFIQHKRITFMDGDASWINNVIKKIINEKNSAYKSYPLF